jgi:phosphopantothenoylcysteine synthetase/decarboxylase
VAEYLAVVACGAPLAVRVPDVAALAGRAGWLVRVVATESALNWLDDAEVERVTGFRALVEQRQPSQPKRFPAPARVVVCPATFNSVNKLAAGIMDGYAAGILCESLAAGTPMTVLPMVSDRLWGHPAWPRNLAALAAAGVTFVDVRTGRVGEPGPVEPGSGPAVAAAFDPAWALPAAALPAAPG